MNASEGLKLRASNMTNGEGDPPCPAWSAGPPRYSLSLADRPIDSETDSGAVGTGAEVAGRDERGGQRHTDKGHQTSGGEHTGEHTGGS